MPRVLAQARVMRKPIVATPVNGTPELVFDDKNGFLRPVKEPEAHAEAWLAIAEDEALRRRLAECTDEPLHEFDQDYMVDRHDELYRKLLGLEPMPERS